MQPDVFVKGHSMPNNWKMVQPNYSTFFFIPRAPLERLCMCTYYFFRETNIKRNADFKYLLKQTNIFWILAHHVLGAWCLKSPITCRLVSGLYLFALFWIKTHRKALALRFHLLNFKSLEGHLVMSI